MRLVVIADSLCFHGPAGPVPLADGRIYPNLLGDRLAAATGSRWSVDVVARAGYGVREVWLALQKDVHLQQQLLMRADAVVMGALSADSLSVGVPRGVLAMLPFVRPTRLRRALRRTIDRRHPMLVRATGARLRYTPRSVFCHALGKSLDALALFAPRAARCTVLPAPHTASYYAGSTRHLAGVRADTAAIAAARGWPTVDLDAIVRPHLGRMNPDGIHWSWPAHAEIAEAMAAVLTRQLDARAGGSAA